MYLNGCDGSHSNHGLLDHDDKDLDDSDITHGDYTSSQGVNSLEELPIYEDHLEESGNNSDAEEDSEDSELEDDETNSKELKLESNNGGKGMDEYKDKDLSGSTFKF